MRFIETVLIKEKIKNIELHNKRMNKTRKDFFNAEKTDLRNYIKNIRNKKVRIVYDEKIRKIEYFDLKPRKFNTFKIVKSDIDYKYKYENRDRLNKLKQQGFDEIIIVKNGLITDTTISNLAFFDGKIWYTPKYPLLYGTKREELIINGKLKEKNITVKDLKKYNKIAMLNAILEFFVIKNFDIIS